MADISEEKLSKLIERYDAMKKQEKMDLSSDQDLSIAIMNLVSIEEHLIFSGAKTGKSHFYALIPEIREMRKELLKTLIDDYEGEVWCISKHLLATSMRLMEVGTKAQSMDRMREAETYFAKAYDLYSLFWGLQMKVIGPETVTGMDENFRDTEMAVSAVPATMMSEDTTEDARPAGFMGKLRQLVRKAVDCCIE